MATIRQALLAGVLLAAACGGGDNGGTNPPPGGGNREWTVMVYMAADNSLAAQGVFDMDEMEAAGVTASVTTVVQAEFSPDVIAQYNNCDASCFNRPNFNTFRYEITGQGNDVNGPNGPATDIGNVDMTSPTTLKNFINYAKATYPANHYLLVLWNHGGGYTGLIQDQTSSGSGLMSVDELKTALTGSGIDVLDFDMCLMAGYETLVKVGDLVSQVVFSEEVVPGAGNPYTSIIDGLQADPTMTPREASQLIVDRFDASYQGDKASTTISAYDMAQLPAFLSAVNDVGAELSAGLPAVGTEVSQAAAASQKYTITELTDIGSFVDHLTPLVAGQTQLLNKLAALKTAATAPAFRIASKARNGVGGQGEPDVSGSTGINIVLPSGVAPDVFNATGSRSLTAYHAAYNGLAWEAFISSYVNGGGQTPTATFDQGDGTQFEAYLVWDNNAIAAGADLDFWVLEPDGNLYIPYLGSVSPNGTFSSDSRDAGVNFEGYLTNRYVQVGDYKVYAHLWTDPQDFEPEFDLAYRYDQTAQFSLFYNPNFPRLSMVVPVENDPSPTLAEAEAGDYTNVKYIGFQTFPAPPAPMGVARGFSRGPSTNHHDLTVAQVATIKKLRAMRGEDQAQSAPRPSTQLGPWQLTFPTRRGAQ
ncbi:MAG TPA: clostripain-related cysteine peptidase [Gemmatimonadales bacterium]|jgi:hypothetical protein